MRKILVLLAGFVVLVATGFGQSYSDLPEAYQEEVSRKEWRQAVRETNKADGDFGLSPIDRIYFDEQPVVAGRQFGIMTVDSWGRDVMLPSAIRQRVIDECGKWPFVVGTVDSGVDEDHSELAGEWWLDASNYTGQEGKHWHGTHVAGIIWQMVGQVIMTHDNGRMKDIQILNVNGSGNFASAANMVATETKFFEPYIEREVGVFLNNSWGYDGPPIASMERELKISRDAGLCWIGAAGNSSKEMDGYPGMSEYFSSVAALKQNLRRASFSTMNDYVDVAAPGQSINSTLPDDKQGRASGTSMASPFITGLAGLAYGKWGKVLMGENMNIYLNAICTDIDPNGWDKETGWGIPLVVKMLDTDPCSLPEFDCEEQPDNPDEPDEPEEPTDPDEPEEIVSDVSFSSTGGHIMRYRLESQQDWSILYVSDIKVSAEGVVPAHELYDKVSQFVKGYFNNRGIVLTDDMDYTDATWWTAQFLEYIGRNEGVPLQVAYIEAMDEQQRKSYQTGFDKAAANGTGVTMEEEIDTSLPDEFFDDKPRPVHRWLIKAEWSVANSIGGGGLPRYNFDDSIGLYYTYAYSADEPTEEDVNKYPPFEGASLKRVLLVLKR